MAQRFRHSFLLVFSLAATLAFCGCGSGSIAGSAPTSLFKENWERHTQNFNEKSGLMIVKETFVKLKEGQTIAEVNTIFGGKLEAPNKATYEPNEIVYYGLGQGARSIEMKFKGGKLAEFWEVGLE